MQALGKRLNRRYQGLKQTWATVFTVTHCLVGAGEAIRTLDPNLGKVMLYP